MWPRLQRILDRLGNPAHREAARQDLHAEMHRLRSERRDLVILIGEKVTVWHSAGGDTNKLLTDDLKDDLTRLGNIESELGALLEHLEVVETGLPAEQLLPSGSMLADADREPTVIEPAPRPTPEPASS